MDCGSYGAMEKLFVTINRVVIMEIKKPENQYEKPKITTYTEKDYRDLIAPVCLGVSSCAFYFNKTESAYT